MLKTNNDSLRQKVLLFIQRFSKSSEVIPTEPTDEGVFFRIRINNKHLCRIRIVTNTVSICEFNDKVSDIHTKEYITEQINNIFSMKVEQFEQALTTEVL